VDAAVVRVEVEPGGNSAGDPDLDGPGCGLRDERAAVDAPDADVAASGLGADRAVRVLDFDVAVCRLDPEIAAKLADLGVPLEFLITAEPSIPPARKSPVAVASSASPVTRSSLMSPASLRHHVKRRFDATAYRATARHRPGHRQAPRSNSRARHRRRGG
jgi:hypothetical protein